MLCTIWDWCRDAGCRLRSEGCVPPIFIVDARIEVDDRTEAYLRALQQKVTSDTQIVSSCWVQAVLGPGGVSEDRGLRF